MKTKILVAMIACLAVAACSKTEVKDKPAEKTTETHHETTREKTETTTPAPADHHSAVDGANTLAADDSAANAAQDADKKVADMKQDMSNTADQMQHNTSSEPAKAETHSQAED